MDKTLDQLIGELRELKRQNPQLASSPVRIEIETLEGLDRGPIHQIDYHSGPARLVLRSNYK